MAEEVAPAQDERVRQLELLDATLRQKQIELDGKEKALDVKLETAEKLLADINNQITVQSGRLEILKESVATETTRLKELQDDQAKTEAQHTTDRHNNLEEISDLKAIIRGITTETTQAREELAGVRKEIKDTQDYLKTQEVAVTDAMEAYNMQLSACTDRIDQLTKQEATIQDNVTTLEEREKEILTQIDDAMGRLTNTQEQAKKAQDAYDKGITTLRTSIQKHQGIAAKWEEQVEKNREEAERFTAYVATERKALDQREAAVIRQEREIGEQRRNLTSDKAVLGAI